MKKRRTYTKEYKQEAVRLVTSGGRSLAEIAKSLGVHENVLAKWVKAAKMEGEDAFRGSGKRTAVDEENFRLRLKVKSLEQELEFLKKVSQYFAKDPK